MELPDLCEICGGVPIDDETLLRTPKFFYREHGDCWCEPTEDASTDAQEHEPTQQEVKMPAPNVCRCCGKPVYSSDGAPIHTRCIVRHWQRHAKGKNVRRCREFGNKEVKA